MRIRTLKPEILTDEKSAGLSDTELRLFVSLIVMADDHGRFRANPAFVHSQVFWASGTSREASRDALDTLARLSLVILYEVAGQQYGKITNWEKHQKVDHPGKPLCPGPDEGIISSCGKSSRDPRETLANIPETLAPDRDRDRDQDQDHIDRPAVARARRKGKPEPAYSDGFVRFWAAYPRKVAKPKAWKAWPGDDLADVIVQAVAKQRPGLPEVRYIPHPATWLNARQWEDAPAAVTGVIDIAPMRRAPQARPAPAAPAWRPTGSYADEAAADPARAAAVHDLVGQLSAAKGAAS
jgi:hypothetical protein